MRHEDSVEAEWTTAAVVSNPLHSSIRQSGMAYWRVAFPLSLSWHVDRVIVCHCYPAFPFPPGGGTGPLFDVRGRRWPRERQGLRGEG